MEKSLAVLLGMAGLAVLALAAFVVYRWRQRGRVRRVEQWVKDYLASRYGGLPDELSIQCSDDALWPVLVFFRGRTDGARHQLRFGCSGPVSSFALLSEERG